MHQRRVVIGIDVCLGNFDFFVATSDDESVGRNVSPQSRRRPDELREDVTRDVDAGAGISLKNDDLLDGELGRRFEAKRDDATLFERFQRAVGKAALADGGFKLIVDIYVQFWCKITFGEQFAEAAERVWVVEGKKTEEFFHHLRRRGIPYPEGSEHCGGIFVSVLVDVARDSKKVTKGADIISVSVV